MTGQRIFTHLGMLTLACATCAGYAQVPGLLNYQGRVAVGGTNFTGTGQFKFALVDAAGGVTFWNNGAAAVTVPVSKGLYSVLLGDTSVPNMATAVPADVFTNGDVRLRVWFDGGEGMQKLIPDQRIAAVGYALVAARANAVDAADVTGTIPDARLSTNVALKNAASTVFTGDVQVASLTAVDLFATRAGIGTASPAESLDVAGAVRVGTTTNPAPGAGTVRWTGTDFQGYDGSQWLSLTRPAPSDMVRVPAGTFMMGSTFGTNVHEEAAMVPVHPVTLSAFMMAKYETTYGRWYPVYLWATNNGYRFQNAGTEGGVWAPGAVPTERAGMPVTGIHWRDCIVWCNAYSEMQGLAPVYTYTNAVIRDSSDANATACDDAVFNRDRNGYRLPTEAEWEYAARYIDGRAQTPGHHASGAGAPYTDAAASSEVAWNSNVIAPGGPCIVGTRRANQLGLYDMTGNMSEHCWDRYAPYTSASVTNPTGAVTGDRIRRGGSFASAEMSLQCALREPYPLRLDTISSFRLVCNAP